MAAALGVTQGAARSYLNWMEDVALVRREGYLFDLIHPLLRLRFGEASPRGPIPLSPGTPKDDAMSVD